MHFVRSLISASALAKNSLITLNLINRAVHHKSLLTKNIIVEVKNGKNLTCRFQPICCCSTRKFYSSQIQETVLRPNITALTVKKRQLRKKRLDEIKSDGKFSVFAYGTAEEYDLEALHTALTKQDLYETKKFYTEGEDVLHVRSKYNVEPEARDIFFFREGSVVMWNLSEPEAKTVLRNLQQFEISPYDEEVVKNEKEIMSYAYIEEKSGGLRNETFFIQPNNEGDLEKYTFSNAMTSSVKLGIWEATLDQYIDGLANVTTDLKEGRKIRMTRSAVLRKTGELFALKHLVNLDSDLLETPDFYWDREELERLFAQTCSYFSIAKRKRVNIVDILS